VGRSKLSFGSKPANKSRQIVSLRRPHTGGIVISISLVRSRDVDARFTWNFKTKIKILGSECQTSGTYAKMAKQATKKSDNAAACLCFLNYVAFLRPAADRAVSILPWVVSRDRTYAFQTHFRRHYGFEEHDFVTDFQNVHAILIGERRMSIRQRPGHTWTRQKEMRTKNSKKDRTFASWWVQTIIRYLCIHPAFPYRIKRKVVSGDLPFLSDRGSCLYI
jgi:hypothetical protein